MNHVGAVHAGGRGRDGLSPAEGFCSPPPLGRRPLDTEGRAWPQKAVAGWSLIQGAALVPWDRAVQDLTTPVLCRRRLLQGPTSGGRLVHPGQSPA